MLELPRDSQEVIALADWLELLALESGDGNSSAGDLVNALQIAVGSERAEQLSLEVFFEMEERVEATGDAYPFHLHRGGVLQAKGEPRRYIAYIFCLFLSYFGWQQGNGAQVNPRLLFEDLACVAAKQYIQGDVFKFGTSRRSAGVSAFREAVNELCRNLGEGQGLRPDRTLRKKDDHVDLVAWRGFRDDRESKLILFGQCATGENWRSKVSELQPEAFWDHWMLMSKVSPLERSFFIPHRIPDEGDGENWRYYARYAGILFDRCRVAYCVWTDNEAVLDDPRYLQWCQSVFPVFR
jgi:hypothetical protein